MIQQQHISKIATYIFYILLFLPLFSIGQRASIHSNEGTPIMDRNSQLTGCLKSLHKDRTDPTALAICECQLDKIDGHFTNKEYRKHTVAHRIDINALINDDSLFKKQIQECFSSSGKTILLQAEGFKQEFISDCIKGIQKNSHKNLDIQQLTNFCNCQLELVRAKKISDAEMQTLNNPNSLLFYEMMFNCGDPFSGTDSGKNWNRNSQQDILGPTSDTLSVLNLDGMTYVKINTGSMTQFWLFDTGSTDLLINSDMEVTLKEENIISQANYLGIGEYEMANGTIDSCRRYIINNLHIGKFTVNNIIIAVTDKGKKIIVGKGLLNKFSNWELNNKASKLILNR